MHSCRRAVLFFFVGTICVAGLSSAIQASAQGYPSKAIRLIVPFPPGGGVDGAARLIAASLSKSLGQQLIVDNRGGAGGTIGAEQAVRSPGDGYTLFFGGSASHSINPNLYRNLSYDALKDFTAIAPIGIAPYVLAASGKLDIKDLAALISLAKAQPGKLNYASAGNGSTLHLSAELFKSIAGLDLVHVPYKGAAQALPDLLSGQVALAVLPLPVALPLAKDGRVRILGVSSLTRSALAPDLPTLAEAGAPGYESLGWYGLFGPAGMPIEVVNLLNEKMQSLLKDPATVEQLAQLGIEPTPGNSATFLVFIKAESDKWAKVIQASGASID